MNIKNIFDQDENQEIKIEEGIFNKLIKSVLNNNTNSLGFLENINKICLNKKKMDKLLQNIFTKDYNFKIKILLYIIIISFNEDFFTDQKIIIINEEEYLKVIYEKILNIINEKLNEKELKFYKYSLIIIFIFLKLKYNLTYNKDIIENLLNKLNTENFIKLFDDIYNNISSIKDLKTKIKTINLISNLFENFSLESSKEKYIFNIKTLSNFYLYITKSKYEKLQNNINSNKIFFFPHFIKLNKTISSLYHKKNSLTKILFYGNSSSGKTTFAKEILNNPLIIDVDESIELNYLLGGYLINEFGEIIWQDGILLSALKNGDDILFLGMEKCGNDLLCILKQILEKNSIFVLMKQENFQNFNSRIIMIYNFNNESFYNKNNKNGNFNINNNTIFNFLSSNSFSYFFPKYSFDDIIQICCFKFNLCDKEKEILIKLIQIYNSIPNKIKINSRYRKLTLNNIIYCAYNLHNFFLNNNLLNQQNIFINEKYSMKIVCEFIYENLLTIDNKNTLNEIVNLFSEEFNFSKETFENFIFNIDEKFLFTNSDFNYIINFQNEKLNYNNLPKDNFYSYNTLSKFYIKLINKLILNDKNILLVGETGVGKTRMIQNLSYLMNIKLNVINLSQSSDESDLLGGFKPVSNKNFLKKYFEEILNILKNNFDIEKNKSFIQSLYDNYNNKKDIVFIKFCIGSLKKIKEKIYENEKLNSNINLINKINSLNGELNKFLFQITKNNNSNKNTFKYIEGILLQSIKNDEWILLDEINLANDDMLLKLKSILEGNSIFLMNNNKINCYKKIRNFRIFGSMNPEYNIGKKRLPNEIREFFNEIFINEISTQKDLKNFIFSYLNDIPQINESHIDLITNFYIEIKQFQNQNQILKSNGNKCTFSLRTLTRTLLTIRNGIKIFPNIDYAIYESISMNFLSQMDDKSKSILSIKNQEITHLNLINEILEKNSSNPKNNFILTKTFINHLKTLIQIITLSNYAVLLEGPTSCGKTSIIEFLSIFLNQKILRINNNQNTEVEEYLGSYTTDKKGNFYFNEGFLIKAVKEGFWIILDEINLCPSEILESLNRLLDDNRELYIPELNKVIKANKNFRIFASMNPSENYIGRKDLSDAFKNRFIHLFFDNIPSDELSIIIEKRCKIPFSRSKIMIDIFKELQLIRSQEKIFMKNEGFITIRDLIKWGNRDINSYEKLGIEGYILLAEKLSNKDDKEVVKKIIESHLKNKISLSKDFINDYYEKYVKEKFLLKNENYKKIKFTKSMYRMITLIDKAISNHEAVLLIGDTGTGKNLSVEFIAEKYNRKLITINCHENMDTNDFLGSLRNVQSHINNNENNNNINNNNNDKYSYNNNNNINNNNNNNNEENNNLFEWVDGPITSSMKNGNIVLIDEIDLVLDSVIERMNSILETDSVLVLSEKNINDEVEIIKPHENFAIISTICPKVNEVKKELSQALKSRFTEIFIEEISDDDIKLIIKFKFENIKFIPDEFKEKFSNVLFNIYKYYNQIEEIGKPMSFRDIDLICEFIECQIEKIIKLKNEKKFNLNIDFDKLFSEAIQMSIIEGLYLNESLSPESLLKIKNNIIIKFNLKLNDNEDLKLIDNENEFGINNFTLKKNKKDINEYIKNEKNTHSFIFNTNTLKSNLLKILRGMSINKPILIEGSPGIGKTTIIQNIAKKLNKKIHRVNLSEHTDMIDLIGSQFPISDNSNLTYSNNINSNNLNENLNLSNFNNSNIDNSNNSKNNNLKTKFKWIDGILLKAMKNNDWLIIDEMNLANQSILEGLNNVLDNKKTLFIPELNIEIKGKNDFQIFATQNPVNQGGNRKFLPKNFLNRFVKIYLDELNNNDYIEILQNIFSGYDNFIIKLVQFNYFVICNVNKKKISLNEIGEFNLRTMIKVLKCFISKKYNLITIINSLYLGRIRDKELKIELYNKFKEIFNEELNNNINNLNIINYNLNNFQKELELCYENNFPIIISGNGNIGKKNLIRQFLQKIKKENYKLNEFYLYSTMDSSELLGSFDKSNINYQIRQYIENYKLKNNEYTSFNILKKINDIENYKKNLNDNLKNDDYIFEWHDSILISSIINGENILLDNVNTCSSAVLDRLNSLLDDDNKIYLNESGENRIIFPNDNFRIFLVMNSNLGEISRALKNRCVEIYFNGYDIIYYKNENIENENFENDIFDNEKNLFYFKGNFNEVNIKLFNFGYLKIEFCLFFDLIKSNCFPFYLAFDMIIIFLIYELKSLNYNFEYFKFRKYKQFIDLFKYFFNQTKSEILSITNSIKILNTNIEIEEKEITNFIYLIHSYFLNFDFLNNKISSFEYDLFLQYHFNLYSNNFIYNLNKLLNIYRSMSLYQENDNKNNKNSLNPLFYFPSTSFILSLYYIESNSIKNNLNKLCKLISVLQDRKFNIPILFNLIKKENNNNQILSIEIKKLFNYSYDNLILSNLIKHSLNTILNIETVINQYKKLIDINFENNIKKLFNNINNHFNLIEKDKNINYNLFYESFIKLSFLAYLINENENNENNILFIRYNSEIFIYIIEYIFNKFFNTKNIKNDNKKSKFPKFKYLIKKDYFNNKELEYENLLTFEIEKKINCLILHFSNKSTSFEVNNLNKKFLLQIIDDINISNSNNQIEQIVIPFISNINELENINDLINKLIENTTFLNERTEKIINNIFDINNDKIDIENLLKIPNLFSNKSLFIFISNIYENFSNNEIYNSISFDLNRLIIIDDFQTNLISKLLNSKDNLINSINEIIQSNNIILYLYPYLYFFCKGITNNIKIIYSLCKKIESFDINLLIFKILEKYKIMFNLNNCNIDNFIHLVKPSKDKIFKIIKYLKLFLKI